MAGYRLSEEAKADLKRIYKRGFKEFGEAKADEYYRAFFRRFDRIADQPQLYPAVDHIKQGYRRSICGVDSIYYRETNGSVEIMRILGRQDARDQL